MKNFFGQFLYDLGKELEVDLAADSEGTCSILFDEEYTVSLEMDPPFERILLFSVLDMLPPGKFREKALYAALRTNGFFSKKAVAAYNAADGELLLFKGFPLEALKVETVHEAIPLFLEEIAQWKQALQTGDFRPLYPSTDTKPSNPFNIQ